MYDCRLQDGKVYANPFQILEHILLSFHPGKKENLFCHIKDRNTHFGHNVLIVRWFEITSSWLLQLWASTGRALNLDLNLLNHALFYCFESLKFCEVVV